MTTDSARSLPYRRMVAWLTLASFIVQPLSVLAQIAADPNAGAYKPRIDAAANGVPLVQITAPSAAGVSRNQYQQFNVAPQGVVLNNSSTMVQTQQAGWIAGNPNLSGATARVILNEVTSTSPSDLRGYTEVAGSRAEVVIANPNGITCDGCGFINTSRGVLTTGTPVFGGGGSLDAFRVIGGSVAIQGAGLNDTATDQLDIIARAVQINAGVWANKLNVIAGANNVNYGDLATQAITGSGTAPTVGIDVALLGGMYANKIRLVGTEAGVGVVSAGNIAAQAGDLTIDNAGRITLTGNTSASGSIAITSGAGVSNSGALYAGLDAAIVTAGQADNTGTFAAKGNLTLAADTVVSSGLLGAGVNADGTIGTAGTLTVNAVGQLAATGRNVAGADIALSGASLDLSGATTAANRNVALTATAGDIDHDGATTSSGGSTTIAASGSVFNRQGDVESAGALALSASALDNTGGRIVSLDADGLNIGVSGQITNASNGRIGGNGDVVIDAGSLVNSAAISAAGALTIDTGGLLDNSGGSLAADRVTLTAVNLTNRSGSIMQSGTQTTNISVGGALDNTGGAIGTNGALALLAGNLGNSGGVIASNGVATISAGAIDNGNGVLYASDSLTLTSGGSLSNLNGAIQTLADLVVSASGALTNQGGRIEANGITSSIDISAVGILNGNGRIANAGSGTTRLDGGALLSNSGFVGSNGDLVMIADNVANNGSIRAVQNLDFVVSGTLDNGGGSIQTGGTNFTLAPASLINNGGTIIHSGAGTFSVATGSLANAGGQIITNGAASIGATSVDNTHGGLILAAGDLDVTATAGNVANQGGSLMAGGKLTVASAGTFQYQNGDVLRGDGGIRLQSAAGLLIDSGTRLESIGAIDLAVAGSFINRGTVVSSTGISVQSGSIDNSGSLISGGNATVSASGATANSGKVSSQRALALSTASLSNSAAGVLSAGTDFVLTSGTPLVNLGILSGYNLILTAPSLDNQGAIAAMNDLTVNVSGQFTNRSGKLTYAGGNQYLYVGSLYNEEDAAIWAGGNLVIQRNAAGSRAQSVINDKGEIQAQGDVVIRADSLTNQGATPAIQSTSFSDSIPDFVDGCPGPGCRALLTTVTYYNSDGSSYDVSEPVLSSYGDPVYYSWWGFRVATQREVDAFYARNPGASPVVAGINFQQMPSVPNSDAHVLECGWQVGLTGSEQSVAPGTTSKAAKLLAGRDFIFDGGNVNNLASQIAAGRDVTLSGNNLVNQGQTLQRTTTTYVAHYQLSAGRHYADYYYTNTVVENIGAVPASITAGRNLIGNLTGSLTNAGGAPALNTRSAQNALVTDNALPASPIAGPGGTTGTLTAGTSAAPASLAGGAQLINGRVDTSHLALPKGNFGQFTQAAPGATYLIETNPLFTNRGSFLSSDYFLTRLGLDPAATLKRLGDGNYEQSLVRDEIFALTGRRFLSDTTDAQAQYQALMDAGVAAAQRLSLSPGIDLTPAQIAALTGDIVWLVEREVAGQKVLVPQVYLAPSHALALQPDGALIAAANVAVAADSITNSGRLSGTDELALSAATDVTNRGVMETTAATGRTQIVAGRDLLNDGGTLGGGDVVAAAGRDLINQAYRFDATGTSLKPLVNPGQLSLTDIEVGPAGRILGSRSVTLASGRDLRFRGGQLASGGDASLAAGHDLDLGVAQKTTRLDASASYGHGNFERELQGGSQIAAAGALNLSAVNDLTVTGSQASAGTRLTARAGNALTVQAATDRTSGEVHFHQGKGGSDGSYAQETLKGSTLSAGQDVTLIAGVNQTADLRITASNVTSSAGAATLAASGDVTIGTQQQNSRSETHTWGSSSGFLSSRSSDGKEANQSSVAVGSEVSAERVTVVSGKNVTVSGSSIVGTNDVTVAARGQLDIVAASNTTTSSRSHSESESGVFSGGGASVTLGSRSQKQTADGSQTWHTGSTVGSVQGNVTLLAGEGYRQLGSDVLAPVGDVSITAPKVEIGAVYGTATDKQSFEAKQSGLTLSITSPVITAVQTMQQMSQAASRTKDSRMKALAAANIAFAGKNAVDAIKDGQGDANGQLPTGKTGPDGKPEMVDANAADKAGGINVSISLGSSQSNSTSTQTSSTAVGSNVAAGRNLAIQATDGDLSVIGSTLNAGNNAALAATGNIDLEAAASTSTLQSNNSGSSASLGIGFSLGSRSGIYLQAGVSGSRGSANGNDLVWTPTSVAAGNALSFVSGQDLNLKGSVAAARQVTADVGGNLNIESLQDTSKYDGKQGSFGASVSLCIPPFCYGASSGSLSASSSKVNSDYASVTTQAGIQAGDGGFQVNVGGNTDLKGGVIASTQQAVDDGRNSFSTGGTLTLSDIQNKAEYQANAWGVSLGTGVSFDGKLAPQGTSAGIGKDSGSASSTTRAGISGVAGNQNVRTGDAANGIQKIFDANKVQNDINAQVQITQSFGREATKAIGDYAKIQTDKAAELRKQAAALASDQSEQAKALEDQAQAIENQWGANGTMRILAHTVVGGLTGGVDGAAGAAAGTLAAPLVSDALAKAGVDPELAKVITAAASTAAGSVVGGASGAAAALNEVANNYLTHAQVVERDARLAKCKTPSECQAIRAEYDLIDKTQDTNALYFIDLARNCTDPAQCAFAKSALTIINQEIFDAEIGGSVRPEMTLWLDKSGAALQEAERKVLKDRCDNSALCSSSTTLAGLVVGAGTAAGAAKLAAYCASPAGMAACASVAAETLEALNAIYNPVRVGVATVASKLAAGAVERSELQAARGATLAEKSALSPRILDLTEANITNTGETVLGSFPGYLDKATTRGASYFDIGSAWNGLTDEQRWAANSHFLDVIAERGDQVFLSTSKTSIQPGTWLAKEVDYLTAQKGYQWVNQWSLRKGP